MYSPACFVKRSLSILILNIWITVNFLHQTLDYAEMSIPVVQKCITLLHHYMYMYVTVGFELGSVFCLGRFVWFEYYCSETTTAQTCLGYVSHTRSQIGRCPADDSGMYMYHTRKDLFTVGSCNSIHVSVIQSLVDWCPGTKKAVRG